jgi:hypothetical protein
MDTPMTLRHKERPGLRVAVVSATGLSAAIAVLPVLGETDGIVEFVLAYLLVLFLTGSLLCGLLVLATDLAIRRLLILGALAGAAGMAAVYLGGHPIRSPKASPLCRSHYFSPPYASVWMPSSAWGLPSPDALPPRG